jgi:peptidoglycan/LPS O-acetylase OafA/YrhL
MHKNNAFDLLRVILALSVLISHCYLIGGYGTEPFIALVKNQTYIAEFGVIGFFALSGYLIAGSYDRSKVFYVFLWHRFLRIFPGFWFCLIITAFVIAPIIYFSQHQSLNAFPFTGANGSLSFIYKNFFLKVNQWSVGDILNQSAYKLSLNGSLWTLLPEFYCYLFILLTGLCGLLNTNKLTFTVITAFVYLIYILKFAFNIDYGPTFLILSDALKLYTSFLFGSLLYIYREELKFDKKALIVIILFAALLLKFGGYKVFAPIAISVICIHLFSKFKASFKYDISYGLYIYAFPIEQLVYNLWGKYLNIWGYLTISLLITCAVAFLSFVLIEKPFLKFKNIFS